MDEKDKRKLVLLLFLTCCFITAIAGVVMIVVGLQMFAPRSPLIPFQATQCQAIDTILNGTQECQCNLDRKEGGEECNARYPCITVLVNYRAENGTSSGNVTSRLMDDESMTDEEEEKQLEERKRGGRYNRKGCSFIPLCSENSTENNETVRNYLEQLGAGESLFVCYYNPKEITRVKVRLRPGHESTKQKTFYYYFLMTLFVIGCMATSISFKWYKMLLLQANGHIMSIPPMRSPIVAPEPGYGQPFTQQQSNNVEPPPPYSGPDFATSGGEPSQSDNKT